MRRAFAVVCILFLHVMGPVGAPGQARFSSGVEAVRVDVQVREGGRPVAGLGADDFELRDSGVRQDIEAITVRDVPLSVLLALDTSASVNGPALDHLKDAARSAIAALRDGDEAALLTFAERIELRAPWGAGRTAFSAAIAGMEGHGSTALNDALLSSLVLSEQARGRRLAIVFTDGADTISYLGARSVISAALATDVVVYAVSSGPKLVDAMRDRRLLAGRSLTDRFDQDPTLYPYALLQKITDQTGGEQIHVESTRDLAGTFSGIVDEFKTRYVLIYIPRGVPKSGWHPLDVKLKGRGSTVTARRGYSR
jgi:Ca-activated chloride channel family protein